MQLSDVRHNFSASLPAAMFPISFEIQVLLVSTWVSWERDAYNRSLGYWGGEHEDDRSLLSAGE